jgi:dihydrofolate reductase
LYISIPTGADTESVRSAIFRGSVVAGLRSEQGDGEIWLFGGGVLFASLLAAGQVDLIEVTIVPVLLGAGIPLLPAGAPRMAMSMLETHTYRSGMITLRYTFAGTSA